MRSRTDFLVFVIGHPPAGKRLIAGAGGCFIALLSRRKSAGIKKDHFAVAFFMFVSWKGPSYCLDASKDALRNSFSVFQLGFGVFLEFSIQCCNFFNQFFHNPFCVTSFIMFRKNTTFLEIIAGISRFF